MEGRRASRLLLVLLLSGCTFLVAAPAANATTAIGNLVNEQIWRFDGPIHYVHCDAPFQDPRTCMHAGTLQLRLTLRLNGGQMQLDQWFYSLDGTRFQVVSNIQCRKDQFFDSDCAESPNFLPTSYYETWHEFGTAYAYDSGDSKKFLNIDYILRVEGIDADIPAFIGTTWRWKCDTHLDYPNCYFTGPS